MTSIPTFAVAPTGLLGRGSWYAMPKPHAALTAAASAEARSRHAGVRPRGTPPV